MYNHGIVYIFYVQAAANEGATKPPALGEVVLLHFVALVVADGQLWELDGRKSGPVPHGPSSRDTLLQVRPPPPLPLLSVVERRQELLAKLTLGKLLARGASRVFQE